MANLIRLFNGEPQITTTIYGNWKTNLPIHQIIFLINLDRRAGNFLGEIYVETNHQ